MEEKCAYRYRVEEYILSDRPVPKILSDCEYCNGYPEKGCVQYTTLEHILDHQILELDRRQSA